MADNTSIFGILARFNNNMSPKQTKTEPVAGDTFAPLTATISENFVDVAEPPKQESTPTRSSVDHDTINTDAKYPCAPSTVSTWTVATPPETVLSELPDENASVITKSPGDHASFDTDPNSSSVPWPGSTFIITDIASGRAITMSKGNIVLAPIGAPGHGSIHWECVSNGGWIGFRDPVSGRYMGHDKEGKLACFSDVFELGWERFCVRMKPSGGYVLFLTQSTKLWPVCYRENGTMLEKKNVNMDDGIAWKFTKA